MNKFISIGVSTLLASSLATTALATTTSTTTYSITDKAHETPVVSVKAKTSKGKHITVYMPPEEAKTLKPGEKVEMQLIVFT